MPADHMRLSLLSINRLWKLVSKLYGNMHRRGKRVKSCGAKGLKIESPRWAPPDTENMPPNYAIRLPIELLNIVNNYMSLYTQWEETCAAEASRRAAEPDEDGFITVTRGPRFTDVAREEEVRELVEKQRKREEGLGDFYRFQTREKRKERQNELLRRFDEDKRKIEKLKMSRGRIMVCLFSPPHSFHFLENYTNGKSSPRGCDIDG